MPTDTPHLLFHQSVNSSERRETLNKTTRAATAVLATAVTTLALIPAAQAADTTTARACVDAANVWVQVDFGEAKDSQGGCATDFGTGLDALLSAGFNVDYADSAYGAVINGIENVSPVWSKETPVYWSYWTGEVNADYSLSYESYMVGASGSTPEAGSVEAWVVGDGSQEPSLRQLDTPDISDTAASGSSDLLADNAGLIAAIASVLALIGGGITVLFATPGVLPGVLLPQL